MSNGSFWFGPYGFLYKKSAGAGGRKNPSLGLICNQPTYLYNKYKPGFSGIGASNISNRRAKNRLATVCGCGKFYNYLGYYSHNPSGFFPYPNPYPSIRYFTTPSTEQVSGWQGIRYNHTSNTYLFSGTNASKQAVLYNGSVQCNILNNYTTFSYPGTTVTGTSAYGPNIIYGTNNINIVGCYNDTSYFPTNLNLGFIYTGSISNLSNSSNYKTICVNISYCTFTYVHSVMGNYAVLCTTDSNDFAESYLYNLTTESFTQIQVPNALTTTAYGIWTNNNNIYTIVGGYSTSKKYLITEIYNTNLNPPQPYPIGLGYIITYNATTNTFYNFTSVAYPSNSLYLTHIEGISGIYNESNTYSIVTTTENNSGSLLANFTKVYATNTTYNVLTNWININYPNNLFNVGDSCANYIVCGMTAPNIIESSKTFTFQAAITPY